jgi:hypothetical protein
MDSTEMAAIGLALRRDLKMPHLERFQRKIHVHGVRDKIKGFCRIVGVLGKDDFLTEDKSLCGVKALS